MVQPLYKEIYNIIGYAQSADAVKVPFPRAFAWVKH